MPQLPPAPIGPVLAESLSGMLPDEVQLETFNLQYLQRHSTSAAAIIAVARALRKLEAPREEVEGCLFMVLNEGVHLDVKVRRTV